MKPIKLIISAFGPYATKMPEINFEQFEDKGLFLISGDTGAGKTTIFDAICFALYGKTSGTYRDTKNLRSEYAKPGTESYVDFYFSHQGKNYHIKRSPSFERINRNGNVTEEKETVIFYYPDGRTVEGTRNVDGTNSNLGVVRELLHIDSKQFMQIAMIAQGEFWSLLNAKTEQRTEILRTIFMTEGYKRIESVIKDQMDQQYKGKARAEQSIVQYFDDVQVDEDDECYEDISDLKDRANRSGSAWNIEELIAAIEALNKADKEELKAENNTLKEEAAKLKESNAALATAKTNNDFLKRVDELEAEKEVLAEQKEEIDQSKEYLSYEKAATRKVNPVYLSWQRKKEELTATEEEIDNKNKALGDAEAKLNSAKAALEEAEKQRKTAETLQKTVDKITEEEPKYQERTDLQAKLDKANAEKATIKESEDRIAKASTELNERIQKLKKTVADLKKKPDEFNEAKNEGNKYTDVRDKISALSGNSIPDWKNKKNALTEKQQEFVVARDSFDEISCKRKQAETELENSRAGLLAAKLEEGKKCPVCGSVHHPEPASLSDCKVTEEDYKKLQEAENKAQDAKTKAFSATESAKTALDQTEDRLRMDLIDCLENPVFGERSVSQNNLDELVELLSASKKEIKDKIKANTALQNALEKDCKELTKAETALEKAQGEESDALAKEKEELAAKKQANDTSLAEITATLKTLAKLSFDDWKTAENERTKAQKEAKAIMDAIDKATGDKQAADEALTAVKAAIETLKKTKATQAKDEEKLKSKFDEIMEAEGFASIEILEDYISDEESLAKSEETIQEYEKAVAANKKQLEQAKKDAKGKVLIDIEELEAACVAQEEKVNDFRASVNYYDQRIKNNTEKLENIKSQKDALEAASKDYNISKRLYDLVRGTTGNGKITLEQYIQAAGFDGIIMAANKRLYPMSDGQYELYRQEDSLGKKSNTFLDLEVLDNYTGHRRPVGNLSGGESFKASLSLALGLSDTVSSNLGGVQMDALFVDEGFGTLDKKSIDNAMDILINLSHANKLVGIISHREELMENIPQQIKVKKAKDGSHISVETGI
ncbi:MAG: SMC family ATPase [Lachnospiraceae bacterium]|nr:SMC family ATPase [Lachnospiraceae bacterium]